jgi:hypothetical protein
MSKQEIQKAHSVHQAVSSSLIPMLQPRAFSQPLDEIESTADNSQSTLQAKSNRGLLGHSLGRMNLRSPSRLPIQPKLTIGQVNDPYEQEADQMAAQVVARLHAPQPSVPKLQSKTALSRKSLNQSVQRSAAPEEEEELQMKPVANLIQRVEEEEEELQMKPVANLIQRVEEDEEEALQMKSASIQRQTIPDEEELQMKSTEAVGGGKASAKLESTIASARGSGQALDETVRQPIEQAFGADFSGVKIHTDAQSDVLNRSLQSRAFTTGKDVFFKQGEYNPQSRSGQELIAHELTHVVQQGAAGNATVQMQRSLAPRIQRDIISDWKSASNLMLSWGRSSELQEIDQLVELLNEAIVKANGQNADGMRNRQRVIETAGKFDGLFEAWKSSKGGNAEQSTRYKKLIQLESSIHQKKASTEVEVSKQANDTVGLMAVLSFSVNKRAEAGDHSGVMACCEQFETLRSQWINIVGDDKKSQNQNFARVEEWNALMNSQKATSMPLVKDQTKQNYLDAVNQLNIAINAVMQSSSQDPILKPEETQQVSGAVQTVKTTGKAYLKFNTVGAMEAVRESDLSSLEAALQKGDRVNTRQLGETIVNKIGAWYETKRKFDNANHMHSEMRDYAKLNTTDIKIERFTKSNLIEGGLLDALSQDKAADGSVLDVGLNVFKAKSETEIQNQRATGKAGKIEAANITAEQAQSLMDSKLNEHTGKTLYPELKNLIKNNNEPEGEVTESRSVGNTMIDVTFDKSDVNFGDRWFLVEAAVSQVQSAGFQVPAFNLYLPKCGKQLTVSVDAELKHSIQVSGALAAAIMQIPNTIHLNSNVLHNPAVDNGLTVRIDPSGVGTIVHELGHFMHYQNSPEKFTGLTMAAFKGNAPDGRPWGEYVAQFVSQYGSNNPREFVAEVFVGLVYKGIDINSSNSNTHGAYGTEAAKRETTEKIEKFTSDDALMTMYRALGGAMPG